MVSQAWKDLSDDEREKWEEMGRQDKARFEMEKSMYTGPWKIPVSKRAGKDPTAPKRPMSAFLAFSNSNRARVKTEFEDAKNADISRILANMWKDAPPDEKNKYIDEEYRLRQEYKIAIAEWRRSSDAEIKSKRNERENQAMQAVREGKLPIRPEATHSLSTSFTDIATVDSTFPATEYNTKMATETFASFPPNATSANQSSPISHRAAADARSSSTGDDHQMNFPPPSYYQYQQQYSQSGSFDAAAYGGNYYHPSNQDGTGYALHNNPYFTAPYEGESGAHANSYAQPNPYGYVTANNYHGKASQVFAALYSSFVCYWRAGWVTHPSCCFFIRLFNSLSH